MNSIIEYSEAECKPKFYSGFAMAPQLAETENCSMQETWRDRAKRAMKGRISQEELAEELGTSQPGVSHWLNNRSQPSLEDINRIADAIGVSRVWLTHGLGYESGPGKELLDVLLAGVLEAKDLEALAVTAKALAKDVPPSYEFAHGNPATAELMDQYVKNAGNLPPEKLELLQRQIEEKLSQEKTKGSATDDNKRRRRKEAGT